MLRKMVKKHFVIELLLILSLAVTVGCTTVPEKRIKRGGKLEVRSGRVIPGYGYSIDARYDRRLDNLVPGYKLLTIVIQNTSFNVIPMDVEKDRWIVFDQNGKKRRAINSLRLKNRKLWRSLPDKVRDLIDYPEYIPISYTVTFDLLFPNSVSLENFLGLRFRNARWGQVVTVHKE